jgi:hypothetical protein
MFNFHNSPILYRISIACSLAVSLSRPFPCPGQIPLLSSLSSCSENRCCCVFPWFILGAFADISRSNPCLRARARRYILA